MPEFKEDYRQTVKGSEDLWECVIQLEAIAHWMRDSSFDYELKDLKYLFADILKTYSDYLYEKTNI